MQITVRSSKVAKTGQNEKGAWELIVVVDETTGVEFTTFDKKAHAGTGAVLDIGEPIIKEGKHSFKKVVEIIKGGVAPSPGANGGQPGMTPELWAEKDRLERLSMESMSAFRGIVELASSPNYKQWDKLNEAVDKALDKALDWAIAHFQQPSEAAKPPAKSKEKAAPGPAESKGFANAGEFLKSCLDNLGMNKTDVTESLSIAGVSELSSLEEAYEKLVSWKNKSPF